MEDANDTGQMPVENDVISELGHEGFAQVLNIWVRIARATKRVIFKTAEKRPDGFNDTIRSLGVVRGDVLMNVDEVFTDERVLLQAFRHELWRHDGGLLV
jgi:hypothetical protein